MENPENCLNLVQTSFCLVENATKAGGVGGKSIEIVLTEIARASDKVRIFISIMSISSPNHMLNHLLESSH